MSEKTDYPVYYLNVPSFYYNGRLIGSDHSDQPMIEWTTTPTECGSCGCEILVIGEPLDEESQFICIACQQSKTQTASGVSFFTGGMQWQ